MACTFSTSQLPKVVRTWCVLYILTTKFASRHNGVHFFDISTSKSGPHLVCFVHFDLEMCFAPQRRALFRHRNSKKSSGPGVFCVLRATMACTFSSLISPDGSAPTALASLLFDPPEPQILGKTQCFATFLPFRASTSSFCWLFLFSDLLSSNLLSSYISLLSASALLCFSSVHIVGSLTSKLPSTITTTTTLHYILLHYTALHYTALNYTQLHYTTLHSTTLHYTIVHYTTLPSTTLHYTTLHSTTLHYTITLHDTTLHFTFTYNYTPLH